MWLPVLLLAGFWPLPGTWTVDAKLNPATPPATVSYRQEVMAVLSRGGCNQGACHGNLNGKGGLKLSLRGEDPSLDFLTLTRDLSGRRVSAQKPDESLLLKKGAGLVAHEGGPRFSIDSPEYRILRDWIAGGHKDDAKSPELVQLKVQPNRQILNPNVRQVALKAEAIFADGSRRDVTTLATYESTHPTLVNIRPDGVVVRNSQPGETVILVRYLDRTQAVPLSFLSEAPFEKVETPGQHPLDRLFFPHWQKHHLQPSVKADDAMYLRRLTLDLLGRLPTAEEARKFLTDTDADKRKKMAQSLLSRPEFADFWGQKWCDVLHNEEKALDSKGVRVFHQWIRDAIAADRPMQEFAAELVEARGSTYAQPPANLYRSLRDVYGRGEAVAQIFLGVRIQCAKCHNHPFDVWKQDDYHSFSALFAQVDYRILSNTRRDDLDKHEFSGEQIVFINPTKELPHPRTGDATAPRLLGSPKPLPKDADRLRELANWLKQPENPFFAKAQVNRVWYHLFGRGMVEPNDDFRLSNPPIHPEAMDRLVQQFAANNYRLKPLILWIVTSEMYQLSSVTNASNAEDETHFSHAQIQMLEAEQLMDAITQVIGARVKFNGYPTGTRAVQMAAPLSTGRRSNGKAERMMRVFGKPDRLLSCECERSEDPGLIQAFQLINGEVIQKLLQEEKNTIRRWQAANKTDAEMIEELFLAAYSRFPRDDEKKQLLEVLQKASDPADKTRLLEDLVWGVINSKEFLLRR